MMFGQAEAGLRKAVKKAEAAAAAAKEYADSFHQEAHRNWMPHWLDERINEVWYLFAPFYPCGFKFNLISMVLGSNICCIHDSVL